MEHKVNSETEEELGMEDTRKNPRLLLTHHGCRLCGNIEVPIWNILIPTK